MEIRVVTFVGGQEFEEMADLTMPQAERILGKPVERIEVPKNRDVFDLKLKYLSTVDHNDPVLCIDTDMIFLDWDWTLLRFDEFNGVPDYPLLSWAGAPLKRDLDLDASKAINGGLWLASRKQLHVFEVAAKKYKDLVRQDYQLRLGDQTALNWALQKTQTHIHYLPTTYNYQLPPGVPPKHVRKGVHVVHVVGNSVGPGEARDNQKKLSRLKEAFEWLLH